jgi:hypothetical protein
LHPIPRLWALEVLKFKGFKIQKVFRELQTPIRACQSSLIRFGAAGAILHAFVLGKA